jgi:hypothetical protein
MADAGIPERLLPAIRLAVFWIALPFIGLLLGGEHLGAGHYYSAGAWFVCTLLSIVVAVYWERLIQLIWPRYNEQRALAYLHNRDSELGSTIISAAFNSAYGKWYAAQILVNSGQPIGRRYLLHTMANQVLDKVLDGEIEIRGRRPGQMDYESIPRTHWRSSTFYVLEDPVSLWRVVVAPRGTVQIAPDGTIASSDHQPSTERTAQLRDYDSLIVNAYQFEKEFPSKDAIADKKRRQFLRQALKRGLGQDEILRLIGGRAKWQLQLLRFGLAGIAGL